MRDRQDENGAKWGSTKGRKEKGMGEERGGDKVEGEKGKG